MYIRTCFSALFVVALGCGAAKPAPSVKTEEVSNAVAPVSCADDLGPCLDGVELPRSSATKQLDVARVISASESQVMLDGSLVYRVDAVGESYLIEPLHAALGDNVNDHVSLAIDASVPFEVAARLVYTAGQSEIADIRIAVQSRDSSPREIPLHMPSLDAVDPNSLRLAVVVTPDGLAVSAHGEPVATLGLCAEGGDDGCDASSAANSDTSYPWAKLYDALQPYRASRGTGHIIIGADPKVPWSTVTRLIDAVRDDRGERSFASNAEFFAASVEAPLFDQPMLAVPQN